MPETAPRSGTLEHRPRWRLLAVAVGYFAVVVALQHYNHAYASEYARDFDEAAHFVTALMVYDYAASGELADPMGFAEAFYLHYPKVALGHWPPGFYLLQAAWMLIVGPSRWTSMILMALLATGVGVCVFQILRRELGAWLAWGAGLVLLLLPLVQFSSSVTMAEVPLALASLLAAASMGRYLSTADWRYAAGFSAFAVMAIMTKPNGLALAFVPLLAVCFSGRWVMLRRLWFWLPAVIVAGLCGPWYWLTRRMMANGPLSTEISFQSISRKASAFSLHFVEYLGYGLFALAILGLLDRLVLRRRTGRNIEMWASLAALTTVAVVFHWFAPADLEVRHIIFSLPPAVCLAAAGAARLVDFVPRPRLRPALTLVLLFLGWVSVSLTDRPALPVPLWNGFGEVAAAVTRDSSLDDSVILVVSDPFGEGAFVSALALQEKRPGHIVLRASKVLSRSNWVGKEFKLVFRTPEEVWDYIYQIPVGLIVVDRSVESRFLTDDQLLLRDVLEEHRDQFRTVGMFPLVRDGRREEDALELYYLKGHTTREVSPIEVDMSLMLGRTLTTVAEP